MSAATDAAAAKAKFEIQKAAIAAAIAAKTGAKPGTTSSNGSQNFSSGDQFSWIKTVSGATFDPSKFNAPYLNDLPANATGEQVLQAFSRLAANPNTVGIWQSLRPKIAALGGVTLTKNDTNGKLWTGNDQKAIENWLGRVHYNNTDLSSAGATYTPPDLNLAYNNGIKNIKTVSGTGTVGTSPTSTLVTVHSSADLASAAQSAFETTLGRTATPKESAAFTSAFQSLENSYGQAKNDAKKQDVFNAPAQPIDFTAAGQKPAPAQNSVPTDTGAIQAPPTPAIAASNFAAKTNPNEASAQALSDALGNIIKNIGG